MAVYTSYNQVGIAEDVSDIITNITPTDTPFTTLIKSEKVHNRTFEYQEDTLAAGADNKAVEGAAFSAGTQSPTTLRTGTTQILTKVFEVSATADAVKTYGRAKETSYQLGKVLKEIKKDLEFAYVGQDNAAVTGGSSTAREMASATQLISNSTDAGSNSTDALTEAKFLVAAQAAYDEGSEPNVFMVKPADSLIVSAFTGASGRYRNFNDNTTTLVNVVDLYVSPFGEYKIVLNRHQLSTHAFLIDPAMWRSIVLRPFSRTLLGKTSDGDTHAVVGEYGLKHMNFGADHMITGLS